MEEFCKQIDCQQAFTDFGSGVPTIIGLLLIVFAHYSIAPRLKEASAAGQQENAELYRSQMRWVWTVALGLFVVHAGFFIYSRISEPMNASGYISGKLTDLPEGYDFTLLDDPETIYVRRATANVGPPTFYWLVEATEPLRNPRFMIAGRGNARYHCRIEQALMPGVDARLAAQFDFAERPRLVSLDLQLDGELANYDCIEQGVQIEQPASGAPGDFSFDIETKRRHGSIWELLGVVAHAAGRLDAETEAMLSDLRSDDFRLRDAAQQELIQSFESYADWAMSVASGEVLAVSREILGLATALSRQDPLPREGMFAMPDLDDVLIDYMLGLSIDRDPEIREAAWRFAISYPSTEMEMRLRRAIAEAEDDQNVVATEALAHFAYNRAILITLANRDGHADAPPLAEADAALEVARRLADRLPDALQTKYAKIDYGRGWMQAVGAGEGLGAEYSTENAQAAFESFLDRARNQEGRYPYPWQLDVAEDYIANPDYGLFNK